MTVGAGRRLKQTSALFYWERRRGYRYNLYLPLQGSNGKKCNSNDGGSVHLWPEPGKAGSRIFLSLRSEHGPRRVSSGKKSIPCRDRPGRISRGPVLSDSAGVPARGGYGGRSKPYRLRNGDALDKGKVSVLCLYAYRQGPYPQSHLFQCNGL